MQFTKDIIGLAAAAALSIAVGISPQALAQQSAPPANQQLDFSKKPEVDPNKKADVLAPNQEKDKTDLKTKHFVMPDNVGVKPKEKTDTQHDVKVTDDQKKGYSAATQCVFAEKSDRNWMGKTKVKFTNVCPQTIHVAARLCADGKPDKLEVFTLGDKSGLFSKHDSHSERVSHAKSSAPKVKYNFCKGVTCTPQMPLSCDNY